MSSAECRVECGPPKYSVVVPEGGNPRSSMPHGLVEGPKQNVYSTKIHTQIATQTPGKV